MVRPSAINCEQCGAERRVKAKGNMPRYCGPIPTPEEDALAAHAKDREGHDA